MISSPLKTISRDDGVGVDGVHNPVITQKSLNSKFDSRVGRGEDAGCAAAAAFPPKLLIF